MTSIWKNFLLFVSFFGLVVEFEAACTFGIEHVPQLKCEQTSDCNKNANGWNIRNKWCDNATKVCCEPDMDLTKSYCPDLATPLADEEECLEYDPKQSLIYSGICPKGGVCRYGRCCPSLIYKDDEVFLDTDSYTTNHGCTDRKTPSPQFHYAYCHKESNKVVIIGQYTNYNKKNQRGYPCPVEGCSAGRVCVTQRHGARFCWLDPDDDTVIVSSLGGDAKLVVLYVGLPAAFVFAILTGIFYALTRFKVDCRRWGKKKKTESVDKEYEET